MDDYGHVDNETPSFAISLYKEYRNQGIGSQLMVKMLELLKKQGYKRTSLNYAKEIAISENCYKMMLLTGAKDAETLNFYRKAGYNSTDKTAFIQWIDGN